MAPGACEAEVITAKFRELEVSHVQWKVDFVRMQVNGDMAGVHRCRLSMLVHIPRKWQIHLTDEIILHVQMLKKCSETRNKNPSGRRYKTK